MRRPKAISFDMGYTLLMHRPTGLDLYRRVLAECGIDATSEAVSAALVPARDHYVRSTREGRDFEASMVDAVAFWTEYNSIILTHLEVAVQRHPEVSERIYTTAWQPENWATPPEAMEPPQPLRPDTVPIPLASNS